MQLTAIKVVARWEVRLIVTEPVTAGHAIRFLALICAPRWHAAVC